MKKEKNILWIFATLAAVLVLFFIVSDLPVNLFSGGSKPVPGKVYELTSDNLAIARRHAPVLVALYTTKGNIAGARMTRGLNTLAERVKNRAIVALGNLDEEPELAERADIKELPAWVIYRDGTEVSRATGENADLSVDRLLSEQSAVRQ